MGLTFLSFIAFVCVISGFAYAYQIRQFTQAWRALPEWIPPDSFRPKTLITVIIPARNEEDNLDKCLASMLAQNYPRELMEVFVVDDFSTDRTPEIALAYAPEVQLIRLSENLKEKLTVAFKKKAIEIGIDKSTGDLILCTDADCIAHPDWLQTVASLYEIKSPKIIAGPVIFSSGNNFLSGFQSLDFLGMMGVTAAGMASGKFQLANGANLSYEKNAFNEVEGFKGVDHLASGDDILLIHKIAARFSGGSVFLKNKNALVISSPEPTFKDFCRQRIRWATKTGQYQDKSILLIWAMVWMFSFSLLVGIVGSLLLDIRFLLFFGILFIFKMILDYRFLKDQAVFYNKEELLRMPFFILASTAEITYVTLAGMAGMLIRNYTWKGRKVR